MVKDGIICMINISLKIGGSLRDLHLWIDYLVSKGIIPAYYKLSCVELYNLLSLGKNVGYIIDGALNGVQDTGPAGRWGEADRLHQTRALQEGHNFTFINYLI